MASMPAYAQADSIRPINLPLALAGIYSETYTPGCGKEPPYPIPARKRKKESDATSHARAQSPVKAAIINMVKYNAFFLPIISAIIPQLKAPINIPRAVKLKIKL